MKHRSTHVNPFHSDAGSEVLRRAGFFLTLFLSINAFASPPTTHPTTAPTQAPSNDSAVDFLFGNATTTPTSNPAPTTASSPLVSKSNTDPDVRQGTITLNDGKSLAGEISTTPGKPLRVWDEKAGDYRDIPMRLVKSIKAQVVWERDEKEWRFKESGSDIKIYTGKTYPARETQFTFTLNDDRTVEGAIDAPLFVKVGDDSVTVILHKRDKGELGTTLKDLKYPSEISFTPQ